MGTTTLVNAMLRCRDLADMETLCCEQFPYNNRQHPTPHRYAVGFPRSQKALARRG